jgi:addiction module RelE/StbE family toxin
VQINWTNRARNDLYSVERYISRDNPPAAVETVLRIIDTVESLSEFANIGRTGRVAGTRELVMPDLPFIVPYRVKSSTIVILRVYHTARKWPDRL